METVRGEKNLREIKMISVNNSSVEGRGFQPAPRGGGALGRRERTLRYLDGGRDLVRLSLKLFRIMIPLGWP